MKRAHPFYYSAAWKAARLAALRRDGYRCVVCGIDVSGKGMSRVDHIKPRSTHPSLALYIDNLRTLCAEHDNQGHREKGRTGGSANREERFVVRGCDSDGWPIGPDHPWNGS